MSQAQSTREDATPPAGGRTFDADLNFLSRWAGPLGLLARAMLAYIFIVEGVGKIAGYAGVVDYMQSHGVDGRLLPLVILTELGGGLLVLFGLKTRWAAIALSGFCLLTALFFHIGRGSGDPIQKNVAMAGGFLTLAILGPGAWSLDAWRGATAARRRRNMQAPPFGLAHAALPCGRPRQSAAYERAACARLGAPIELSRPRHPFEGPECRPSTSSRPATASPPARPTRPTSRSSRRSLRARGRWRVNPSSKSPSRPTSPRS